MADIKVIIALRVGGTSLVSLDLSFWKKKQNTGGAVEPQSFCKNDGVGGGYETTALKNVSDSGWLVLNGGPVTNCILRPRGPRVARSPVGRTDGQ